MNTENIKTAIQILIRYHRREAERCARGIIRHAKELQDPYGPAEKLMDDALDELGKFSSLIYHLSKALPKDERLKAGQPAKTPEKPGNN